MIWFVRVVMAGIVVWTYYATSDPCSTWAWDWLDMQCFSDYVPNPECGNNPEGCMNTLNGTPQVPEGLSIDAPVYPNA